MVALDTAYMYMIQIILCLSSILQSVRKNSDGVNDNSCDNACREIILKGVSDTDDEVDDDDNFTTTEGVMNVSVLGWTV